MNIGFLTSESYHVKVGKERISVRSLDTGNYIESKTEFVANEEKEVVEVFVESSNVEVQKDGQSNSAGSKKVDPFGHLRVIMYQFYYAEALVEHLIDEVRSSWWKHANIIFLQLTYEPEGGVSEVEKRALRDSMEHAGGKRINLIDPFKHVSDRDIDYAYDVIINGSSYDEEDELQVRSMLF